jgi:hypothetical protein
MAGSINEFKSSFNTDLAKPSRFDVEIPVPLGLVPYIGTSRRLTFRCENAELPGRSISTMAMKIYGPEEKFPYQTTYNDMDLTFIVGDDMREKIFFDSWLEWINPSISYNFKYKADYTVQMRVNQYDLQNKVTYSVDLIDAFPISVNAMALDWSSDGYHKVVVNFAYTSWRNNSVQALGQRLLEAGVGFTTDRFGGNGLNNATAGSGISVQSIVNGFKGLTASKLGTDIPAEQSLSPGEEIVK